MPLVSIHVDNWEFTEPVFSVRNDMLRYNTQSRHNNMFFFFYKRWSLGKLTAEGAVLQDYKFWRQPTLSRDILGQDQYWRAQVKNLWRQVCTSVCVERKIHRWTWRGKKGSIKSISAFCSESSAAYPKTCQNQTRYWGRCMQSGFLLEGLQDFPFDNFNLLCISNSMLLMRWWEIKRRNYTSLGGFFLNNCFMLDPFQAYLLF